MRFNYGKIFLVGFGSFGFSLIWLVYNSFVPLFLQDRFHLMPGLIGLFMTFDNIAALLIQPPVGALSDRLRTPLGRRMPFILVGVPVAALVFALIPQAMYLPLFVTCTITLLLSMALWRTPVVALMSDVTPSQFRSQANGITNLMGGVGGILASLGGAALFGLNPAYPFWMGSALIVLAAIILLAFVREPKTFYSESQEAPDLLKSLRDLLHECDRSGLRLLLAIFCLFITYNAIEAFFTLYANNHLGLPGAEGARLLGQFLFLLILCALPAGFIGGRFGRKPTIIAGLAVMISALLVMFFLDVATLTIPLFKLPVLGNVPVIGLFLMAAGAGWALINVNTLPMVVDLSDDLRVGTYTGLYYLFVTLAAIAGPNINGWIVQLTGSNYNVIMISAPFFMLAALVLMLGVRRGEARAAHQEKPLPADSLPVQTTSKPAG